MEMFFILVLIVAVVCLDIATFLWGCDSRDGIDSPPLGTATAVESVACGDDHQV